MRTPGAPVCGSLIRSTAAAGGFCRTVTPSTTRSRVAPKRFSQAVGDRDLVRRANRRRAAALEGRLDRVPADDHQRCRGADPGLVQRQHVLALEQHHARGGQGAQREPEARIGRLDLRPEGALCFGRNPVEGADPAGEPKQPGQMIIDRRLGDCARTDRLDQRSTPWSPGSRHDEVEAAVRGRARRSWWRPSPTSAVRPNPIRT